MSMQELPEQTEQWAEEQTEARERFFTYIDCAGAGLLIATHPEHPVVDTLNIARKRGYVVEQLPWPRLIASRLHQGALPSMMPEGTIVAVVRRKDCVDDTYTRAGLA